MSAKIVLVICALVAVVSALPAAQPGAGVPAWGGAGAWGNGGANPWIPPWVATAPWMPQWTPCTGVGSSCLDCSTRLVCTKIGSLQHACTDPTLPHCNLGKCSATPSAECGVIVAEVASPRAAAV